MGSDNQATKVIDRIERMDEIHRLSGELCSRMLSLAIPQDVRTSLTRIHTLSGIPRDKHPFVST